MGGGTTLAAAKLYNMHLEQQGKYGSTLIYGEATNTDATGTDAEVDQNALYTLDVSYVPEGMKVDGLDDIYADGNNYVKKVVLFPEDSSFIGGVSFWFLKCRRISRFRLMKHMLFPPKNWISMADRQL